MTSQQEGARPDSEPTLFRGRRRKGPGRRPASLLAELDLGTGKNVVLPFPSATGMNVVLSFPSAREECFRSFQGRRSSAAAEPTAGRPKIGSEPARVRVAERGATTTPKTYVGVPESLAYARPQPRPAQKGKMGKGGGGSRAAALSRRPERAPVRGSRAGRGLSSPARWPVDPLAVVGREFAGKGRIGAPVAVDLEPLAHGAGRVLEVDGPRAE